MKKKPPEFRPNDIIAESSALVIRPASFCFTNEQLMKALHIAFTQGVEAAEARKPAKTSSAQKLYADRYAALRDLMAYDIRTKPIKLSQEGDTMKVILYQGDALDQFIDAYLRD